MAIQRSAKVVFHKSPVRFTVNRVDAFTVSEAERIAQDRATPEQILEVRNLFGEIHQVVGEFEQRRQQMIGELQSVAVEIGVAVAAKLTFQEVASNKEFIVPMVRQLIGNLDQQLNYVVWVNPADYAVIQKAILAEEEPPTHFRFQIDNGLAKGDCRVDDGNQSFVSSLQTKIAEIRQKLIESLHDAEIERRNPDNDNRGIRRFPDRRATG